ncbi:MAG TPA: hypothetical protein VN495_03135 [Candidatus Paceibacterota bacterium]|nr:hypothetical protein [Candidatus Paceibacterota bacterium]
MRIVNLTQHVATQDQQDAGVFEPTDKAVVQALLTFEQVPSEDELFQRAERLAFEIARTSGADAAMIGGAPYFMAPLESRLRMAGLTPLYSFTQREAVDIPQADGSVKKSQIFKHVGWVEATTRLQS